MEPTYSFSEIKQLLPLLDVKEVDVLVQVCLEEESRYPSYELRGINRLIGLAKKRMALNAVQMEYLLSFN